MKTNKTNEFYLPILDKVTIYDYSLYKCPFEIDFSSKLNIIYGTNGIGKTTLLKSILGLIKELPKHKYAWRKDEIAGLYIIRIFLRIE